MHTLRDWTRRFVAVGAALGLAACAPSAANDDGNPSFITVDRPMADEYIVVLNPQQLALQDVRTMSDQLALEYQADVLHTFKNTINGFGGKMSEDNARVLALDPRVAWVEENGVIQVSVTQEDAPWGLDRLDQANLPLDTTYQSQYGGAGVHVYIVDTGILASHTELEGRVKTGFDAIDGDQDPTDCQGHGTHVAGIAVGATYGVAKKAFVHGVRVLDCNGMGTTAEVIAGLDWITENVEFPAVVNMSLGGSASPALDQAVRNSLRRGVPYVLAAGNGNQDACNTSPARVKQEAITVGATDRTDHRASYSNHGPCLDIFAPGTDIPSASLESDTAYQVLSGTSMAAPHVTGAAALYLGRNPAVRPEEVRNALVQNGLNERILDVGSGSPNTLLNLSFLNQDALNPSIPAPLPPSATDPFTYAGKSTRSARENTMDREIALVAGDVVTIGTCGIEGATSRGDTYLRLFFIDNQVAENDDDCGGFGSRIIFTAQTDGVYQIRAGCFADVACQGRVAWSIDRDGGPILMHNTFTYEADKTDNAKKNTVNRIISIPAFQTLIIGTCGIEGSSFEGNTYIRLFDDTGDEVRKNDDACDGRGSQIIFTASETKDYEIHAGCKKKESCRGTIAWFIRNDG